jgi:hypothetical protein
LRQARVTRCAEIAKLRQLHGLAIDVTGTSASPDLPAQRAGRVRTELSALDVAHCEVASATLDHLRERLAAGIDEEVAAAAAIGESEDPQPDPSDAAHARPVWTAVPVTPSQRAGCLAVTPCHF